METYEPQSNIMTRHEIFTRLVSCANIINSDGVGERVSSDTWKYIDFLLDAMLDIDYLETHEDITPPSPIARN